MQLRFRLKICRNLRPLKAFIELKLRHMGPEGVLNRKKTPIFFVDAKRSQIAQEFQKHKS